LIATLDRPTNNGRINDDFSLNSLNKMESNLVIQALYETNPMAATLAATMSIEEADRILMSPLDDTPANRIAFHAAWAIRGSIIEPPLENLWFAKGEERAALEKEQQEEWEREEEEDNEGNMSDEEVSMERYGCMSCSTCGYSYSQREGECVEPGALGDVHAIPQHSSLRIGHTTFTLRALGRWVREPCSDCHPQFIVDRQQIEKELEEEEMWDNYDRVAHFSDY